MNISAISHNMISLMMLINMISAKHGDGISFFVDPCFNRNCKRYETCVIKADDTTNCGK